MNKEKDNLPAAGVSRRPCEYRDPVSSHPLFSTAFPYPCVLVFERKYWSIPTDEQAAEYERKRLIVESLDGRMIQRSHEIAGKNPPLSAEDVEGILLSVRTEYPNADIEDHWNGEGCYTMSVRLGFMQGTLASVPPQTETDVCAPQGEGE